MDEKILSKEQMDAVQFLAETNMKIGEAKATLIKLEQSETSYFEEREKKVMGRIQKVLDDSKDLLIEAQSNYSQIRELRNTVSSVAGFLSKAYEAFVGLLKDFRERNDLWDNKVSEIEEGFAKIRQEINSDKVRIINDQESLKRWEKSLDLERKKIVSDRGELDRAITRLKEGRI